MKQKLSLVQVCKIPDVQIHSKTSFLKSMVNFEKAQALQMKDQIISLSYTVKTIGVQGDEVGITSKRLPLKLKNKQQYPKPTFEAPTNFLPHQSFYSHALIPIKKQRQNTQTSLGGLHVLSARNTIQLQEEASYEASKFKIRTKSMSQLRRHSLGKKKKDQQIDQLGTIERLKRVPSGLRKKSFSSLLKECNLTRLKQEMNPLMHQQNPLFKKIKRIKEVYPELSHQFGQFGDQRDRPKTKFSSSSNLFRIYREAS